MNKIVLLSILFATQVIQAQSDVSEPIQTDRPDQTETPSLTPFHRFQVETGFSYEKTNENSSTWVLPTILWKYGLSDNFELRLITEWQQNDFRSNTTNGITPVLLGCKIKISEENGWFPQTSIIGHLGFPTLASSVYKTDFFAPEFRFVMQHTLSEKLSFSYNLGAEWNGTTPETTFIYTTALGYSISEKIGCYAEIYGFAPEKETANHNFDGGFTYLLSSDFMFDVSGGFGITENAPDYYVALGFSFRI